jgi:hypothetical protein
MYKYIVPAAAWLSLCAPLPAVAASGEELNDIRNQMEALKRTYETQIKALEERLQNAEKQVEQNRADLSDAVQAQPAAPTASQSAINAFNPAISVILQGSVNSYSEDPNNYALPGFQLGDEAGLAKEGMTLDETEITASANVDPLFYAQSTFSLSDTEEGGTEISIEEAYVDPLALPAGLGSRFGRFYSGIGYLNPQHSHTWDFHDQPLAYRAFLNNQYGDDGMRVTWTAPTDMYLMFGGETFAGNNFPAGESTNVVGDVQTLFMKLGGDIGDSSAWQGGLSALWADAHHRQDSGSSFTGDSDLYIADFVYKWAPFGNPELTNFKFQTEFFYRRENGNDTVSDGTNTALMDYKGDQTGWYAQAIYQFIPRWRAGLRYDRLTADNNLAVLSLGGYPDAATVIADSGLADGHDPQRWSLMFDWSPSEFSRIRAQYDRDQSRSDATDNQWMLQYIMSIGSHGAHLF